MVETEWLFATAELPGYVDDGGDRFRPTALLFMDASTGHLFASDLVREVGAGAVADAFEKALAEAESHGGPTPARIRVASDDLAETLRQACAGRVDVRMGPTSELDDVRRAMIEYWAREPVDGGPVLGDGVPASYLDDGRVEPSTVEAFFAAARAFHDAEPWMRVGSAHPLRLDIPQLAIEAGGAIIVYDEGNGGLVVIPEPQELLRFQGLAPASEEPRMPANVCSVAYYARADLPAQMQRDLDAMPFAGEHGPFPALYCTDNDGIRRPLATPDYELTTAVLTAVHRFVEAHEASLDSDPEPELDGSYELSAGGSPVEVMLRLPHDAVAATIEATRPSPRSVHRLKVALLHAKPPIWRRIVVPSRIHFDELHRVIQLAMGWEDAHLHQFAVDDDLLIGPNLGDDLGSTLDERDIELWTVAPSPKDSFDYLYDYGDHWNHRIVVEDVSEADEPLDSPRCLTGRRACPPEDVGGIPGYEEILAQLGKPRRGRRSESLQMVPDGFDPAAFDREQVNWRLRAIRFGGEE